MPSMKQIKKRKRSVESTGKITKAMKLVASVKLQRTKQAASDAVPYFDAVYETISDLIRKSSGTIRHKYITGDPKGKNAIIVLSSNKGLAGGYNSNIVRKILNEEDSFNFNKDNTLVYAIGARVRDELARRGFTIERDYSEVLDDPHLAICKSISDDILDDFVAGKINNIYLIYTFFKNTIVHIPRTLKLLPFVLGEKDEEDTELTIKKPFEVAKSKFEGEANMPMNYDMEDEEMLNYTIPSYIATLIYGAMTAAIASENGARMTAMDNATKNAKELSEKLGTMYNRARQGAITQELTEIVAGANAI